HLSRPACSHVKELAKGRDACGPAWEHSHGRVFFWPKEAVMPASKPLRYRPETRLVHAGQIRSELGETSETLFLTQGFVYDTAEECAARFKGEEPGFVYARFSNPTV